MPDNVLLAYVDESYTANHFYLAAVVASGDAVRSIEAAYDDLVSEYAARFAIGDDAELHGHDLFQGDAAWGAVPTRARINVYRRALRAIAEADAQVILRGMDVARQRQRYMRADPPHEVVLGHLLERVNLCVAAQRAWSLVVADEVHTQERHRTNFRDFRLNGTPGYMTSTLPRLLDTIHFAPSHHSRLLQAADLVAFLHRRRETHVEADPRAARANDQIWAEVEPAVIHRHCWVP